MALSSASRLLALRAHKYLFDFLASRLGSRRLHRVLLRVGAAIIVLALVLLELRWSWLESRVFTAISHRMTFTVLPGAGNIMHYPRSGPYDERLGYSLIPEFLGRMEPLGYRIEAQARPSKLYLSLTDLGLFPIYHEKAEAGLQILDREGRPLYEFRHPEQSYREYSQIPRLVVDTLLSIENRAMLDPRHPNRNPAVEWWRLSHAVFDFGVHAINPYHAVIGGSTLATQLEKMRHSPGGRTHSASEKVRQMLSGSIRAYQNGPHTMAAQHGIVRDYLNSLPLAAAPGHGEIIGLGDGLQAWYGADFGAINELLNTAPTGLDAARRQKQARGYRQVLSLLLATRAPSRYLVHQPDALAEQTDRYLRLLCKEGIISTELRDLALCERPVLRPRPPVFSSDLVDRKARTLVDARLLSMLGLQNTYALDRLDLSVRSTIDGTAQRNVTRFLRRLTDPGEAATANLRQNRLLAQSDPRSVIYGLTLYERGPGLNLLRIQTDNYNQPLNINEGTNLELGSTAKLRTLINYLEIIEELHQQYAHLSPQQLSAVAPTRDDRLTRWAIGYLSTARDSSLRPMLEAALERQYSATPAEGFFTAGGLHHFRNFESSDDHRMITVREAFERSVNLVFIRLMRDIKNYYLYRIPGKSAGMLLRDPSHPDRRQYLVRFADREGCVFLARFYHKYAGLQSDRALENFINSRPRSALRLAVVYRSVRPDASREQFTSFLRTHLRPRFLRDQELWALYEKYGPDKFSLADRGYLARVHPLELWLVSYFTQHPHATLAEVVNASARARQESYVWLFRTRHTKAQDTRIRVLLEEDAFKEIWRAWSRVGYPFRRLVPSYATAVGASGDTPEALAELVGIIVNNGMCYPRTAIGQLRFAQNTPMETILRRAPGGGQRVLSVDVATLVRQELIRVVKNGTARRACCSVVSREGLVVPIGGKTGTGDNRVKTFSAGGRLLDSRVANRTAVFVFMIGDRFFGTVMVFVPGEIARNYEFTSSLAVQILKDLLPMLKPVIDAAEPADP